MAEHTSTLDRARPIMAFARQVEAGFAELRETMTWSMSSDEAGEAALLFTKLEAQMGELGRRVLGEAERQEVSEKSGATSPSNWLAHGVKMTRREAHARFKQAASLETYEQTRLALASGGLQLEQATAITTALDALPSDKCPPETLVLVEKMLLEQAETFDAAWLRILGRKAWEVIDPDAAEAHEAEQLEKEEERAAVATKLTMQNDGSGLTRGRFTIPEAQGAMFKKLLLAFAAPKHQQSSETPTPVNTPSPQRMGQAFCEMIEAFPRKAAPRAGGVSSTAVVHLPFETLMGAAKAARLDTGEAISPGQARRIACEAGIIPAVLSGQSQVLDLGRSRRFHSRSQRIAAGIEHPQCQAANCDWPSGMCHLHHLDPWSKGGRTDLERAAVLCPRHHTLIHHDGYETVHRADGSFDFYRRT